MVTDMTRFAWLSDVYVLPVHRGRGLGKWLVDTIVSDPALARIKRIVLSTRDAHSLYERMGFSLIGGEEADRMMMLVR